MVIKIIATASLDIRFEGQSIRSSINLANFFAGRPPKESNF